MADFPAKHLNKIDESDRRRGHVHDRVDPIDPWRSHDIFIPEKLWEMSKHVKSMNTSSSNFLTSKRYTNVTCASRFARDSWQRSNHRTWRWDWKMAGPEADQGTLGQKIRKTTGKPWKTMGKPMVMIQSSISFLFAKNGGAFSLSKVGKFHQQNHGALIWIRIIPPYDRGKTLRKLQLCESSSNSARQYIDWYVIV